MIYLLGLILLSYYSLKIDKNLYRKLHQKPSNDKKVDIVLNILTTIALLPTKLTLDYIAKTDKKLKSLEESDKKELPKYERF